MRKGFFLRLALTGIRKNRKVYYPYILTAILTVAMLYMICSLAQNPDIASDTVSFTLGLGVVVTTAFSVVFLFYTNSFLMKRRKKEFGLYNILGMEKRHIGRVVLWETVIILLLSLLCGFAIGLMFEKLLFMILLRMLGEAAKMSLRFVPGAMLYTALAVGITFLLILLNSLRQIHLSRPVELLHGGEVGEREPKAKWVLALLGVLTLGGGYFISISVTNAVASILLFFVAVLLVIAGTYLLFTAGSVTLLKLLRKNKGYYYQPDHFISVSGMIYRMKQNAVGLGNVCILSTMVLVMVFSTFSLWMGMDDTLKRRSMNDIEIETRDYERAQELRATVTDEIQKAGLVQGEEYSYRYLSFAGYRQGDFYSTTPGTIDIFSNDLSTLFVVTLEDYNRLNGTEKTLEADEILIASHLDGYSADTLSVFDRVFRVKERDVGMIPNGQMLFSVYPTQMLVVRDWDTLLELDAKQRDVYGKNASPILLHVSFALSNDIPRQEAFYQSLRAALKGAETPYASYTIEWRESLRRDLMRLYGGLLFIGLFLGALFSMAMILIVYYKQISEGYDDRQRYQIMQKVGLSRAEIKRSIGSQILVVFFLPLLVAGIHVAFSFPSLTRMFSGLGMYNVPLMAVCAVASFAVFAALYGVVYILTARVYYKIVSE